MRFLCLVYGDEPTLQKMSVDECIAYDEKLRAGGQCLASESLEPTSTAATVRVRNGKAVITDGPFMEAKEYFGGYMIVDCDSIERATEIATHFPPSPVGGAVEVRPLMDGGGSED